MTRHLIPRIDIGGWGGGGLTIDPVDGMQDDIAGAAIVIQWLGLLIEIGISDDIKDVYGEAKATGFDVKTIRQLIRLRRMEKHHREEAEALLETYKAALGLA